MRTRDTPGVQSTGRSDVCGPAYRATCGWISSPPQKVRAIQAFSDLETRRGGVDETVENLC